ncbi:MAG: IPT/TIG domain-containing protein [Bacteroidota bacterium]
MKPLKKSLVLLTALVVISSCSKKDEQAPTPTPPTGTTLTITSISPEYGKAGTEITITGANFGATSAANTVTLGGKAATVTAATSTQLKITAPADATHGAIEVKVGTATATSKTFYYEPELTTLSVTNGKAGDAVTITGKHFSTNAADFEVKFNSVLAEITAATATTLSVKVPANATTGAVTVARKTKTPVSGPTFTIGGAVAVTGFTVTEGSIAITALAKTAGTYGQIVCMTVDEVNNIVYAGTTTQIIKIDLATGTVSTILNNSSFLTLLFAKPSAMDVDATGKLYLLSEFSGVTPTTPGSNVFVIDPVAKTATALGNRYIGVNLGGSTAYNVPFQVMGNGEIITFDGTMREFCKFSANLSTRTVIYTLPVSLESFVQLVKVDQNTCRIVLADVTSSYYYDYTTTLGAKTDFNKPAGSTFISATMGGTNKYGIAGLIVNEPGNTGGIPKKNYTIGKLNTAQTGWEQKASFTIDKFNLVNGVKYHNFISLNGKNFFYADKNGNMYALIMPNYDTDAGIYKFTLN